LDKPDTSGGMKSLLVIRSPEPRGFFDGHEAGLAERLTVVASELIEIDKRGGLRHDGEDGEDGDDGSDLTCKSNTWCVGTQSCSLSEPESGLTLVLSILDVGMGESPPVEPTEVGGDAGRL
jgi:hypothetical protein